MTTWQRWKGIMKCYPFEEKRLAKWQPPYIVQPKYDGVRCRAIRLENGEFLLLSSEENIIYSVPHINRVLADRIKTPCELDGELYCHGMSFEQIVSRTSRSVNIHEDHKEIQYHIFDIVNESPQGHRLMQIAHLNNVSPYIKVAPYDLCYNLEDIMRVYDKYVGTGHEGIIVRHLEAPYERKRSTYVMKFKPKQEDSYEITGFEEEISKDGQPKDTLGSLILKSGDGNTFNCGTGFNAEQRRELWDIRGLLVGEVAKVKYQHLSDKHIPRFPVFVEVKFND
jgi:DNA ligase 1